MAQQPTASLTGVVTDPNGVGHSGRESDGHKQRNWSFQVRFHGWRRRLSDLKSRGWRIHINFCEFRGFNNARVEHVVLTVGTDGHA